MENSLATCCKALHPVIRARWTELLRAAPPPPPATRAVMTPDMLEFLVDETLDQLTGHLPLAGENRPAHHAPLPCGRRFKGCGCGLHLMLTFYTTGAQALHETLPDSMGHARLQIMQSFNELAHEELAGLCAVCHYREGGRCRLRAALKSDRNAAKTGSRPPRGWPDGGTMAGLKPRAA